MVYELKAKKLQHVETCKKIALNVEEMNYESQRNKDIVLHIHQLE
jgi:hypothetical protein